jgi:hypothetical protein
MAGSSPTPSEWRKLYQAAIRVKEIASWDWMTETDIFGVQGPETDEIGFVSIMGMLGEHLAVAVYPVKSKFGPSRFSHYSSCWKRSWTSRSRLRPGCAAWIELRRYFCTGLSEERK